jgi:endonuclease V-like protein UPF0215 family
MHTRLPGDSRRGRLSHVIAFDDAPFPREHRGDVPLVGVVFAGDRLDGVCLGRARRDGAGATDELARLVARSPSVAHLHLILLEGIAVAGFNVVDIARLHAATGLPVLVVIKHLPDMASIERALLGRVPGGRAKWRRVLAAGPIEPAAGVYVQRAGLSLAAAAAVIHRFARNGRLPEPLRVAHLIAGALGRGSGQGRNGRR